VTPRPTTGTTVTTLPPPAYLPPWTPAQGCGFTPGATVNVDTAWQKLIALGLRNIVLPPGCFDMTVPLDANPLSGVLTSGAGSNPLQYDHTPDPKARTYLRWTGTPGAPMFRQDGGTNVLKPGAGWENISFVNAHKDYTGAAQVINNADDWYFRHCGFYYFGQAFALSDLGGNGPDNAHGTITDCFGYGCEDWLSITGLYGVAVTRGQVIGEGSRKQRVVNMPGGQELKMRDLWAVGCQGGFGVIAGGYVVVSGCIGERCGSSTAPVLDVLDAPGFGGVLGSYGRYTNNTFVASAAAPALPSRIRAGADNQWFIANVHDGMLAYPGKMPNQMLDESGNSSNVIWDAYDRPWTK
jgi:hypothetical protein